MGNIVLLDDLTINKIAAGEVIERPANVVKELVENSIDAGAKSVTVEIKKGGKTFIKVTDNGKGMKLDDMRLSLERHATSKIRKVEDLENTYTMGFRGEALASITAISKLTMVSKMQDEDYGIKLEAEAGDIINIEEVASQVGTSITVENLFFNVPVRYKFLKQDATEFRYIKELVEKIALSNTSVSIKLINDGKIVFQTNGSGNIHDVIYLIYGKEIQKNIIDVNYEEENIKITGVVGNTRIAKDTRKDQIIFLNKRNIKNATLSSSADQAFKGSTGIGKYGFFILNIEMPANMYDVNVHPTKIEVRFKNEDEIYKIMYRAIKSTLLNEEFLGNNESSSKKENYVTNEFNFLTNHFKNNNFWKSKIEGKQQANAVNIKNEIQKEETFKNELNKEIINNDENEELRKRETKRKIDYKFIGISFKTYIIVQIEDDIYLIDQHAAHERLLYEKIKENYKNKVNSDTQMLLIPEVIELTHKEAEFVKDNIELFKKTGYDIDFFGENTVKINGIPNIDYREKTNTKAMFMDILDEMITNSRTNIKDVEERFIATVACKAAVKAGMDLTQSEVDYLLQNMLVLQNPYTCPHGRPTTIKINKSELSWCSLWCFRDEAKKHQKEKIMYYTYMLRCEDNSIYTGITTDVERRMEEHFMQNDKCAKYTKRHKAKNLEALWQSEDRVHASKLEYAIKTLKKSEKEDLIRNKFKLENFFKERLECEKYVRIDTLSVSRFM